MSGHGVPRIGTEFSRVALRERRQPQGLPGSTAAIGVASTPETRAPGDPPRRYSIRNAGRLDLGLRAGDPLPLSVVAERALLGLVVPGGEPSAKMERLQAIMLILTPMSASHD